MKLKMILVAVVLLSVVNVGFAAIVSTDTFGVGANEISIDFVNISGGKNPTSGYGIVKNDYRMGVLEISNDQYAKFATNSNVYHTGADVPANRISWYEAAQFVNYLNTITGNQAAYKFNGNVMGVWKVGDTGYDASNPFRNSNAKYFLPTENEWVKAAYWNGTSLQTYSNASAGDLVSGSPDPTKWNYSPSAGNKPWSVDNGAVEINGTKNMMGNVWEWMESPDIGAYLPDTRRGLRGGSYDYSVNGLSSSFRHTLGYPTVEYYYIGFRVASVIPEPCSLVLLGLGGLVLRRRKR